MRIRNKGVVVFIDSTHKISVIFFQAYTSTCNKRLKKGISKKVLQARVEFELK